MTNADWIRNMTNEPLAYFINIERPNCNEICEDFDCGCAFRCKHKQGENVVLKWLSEESEY